MVETAIRCSITFLVQGNHTLLALGKKGVNKGKRSGYGGKVEPGENKKAAAARELKEESTVTVRCCQLLRAACITFMHEAAVIGLGNPARITICDIYLVKDWAGIPTTTEAMASPLWFSNDKLPWDEMPADYKPWLLDVLRGECFAQTIWDQAGTSNPVMIGKRTPLTHG